MPYVPSIVLPLSRNLLFSPSTNFFSSILHFELIRSPSVSTLECSVSTGTLSIRGNEPPVLAALYVPEIISPMFPAVTLLRCHLCFFGRCPLLFREFLSSRDYCRCSYVFPPHRVPLGKSDFIF